MRPVRLERGVFFQRYLVAFGSGRGPVGTVKVVRACVRDCSHSVQGEVGLAAPSVSSPAK